MRLHELSGAVRRVLRRRPPRASPRYRGAMHKKWRPPQPPPSTASKSPARASPGRLENAAPVLQHPEPHRAATLPVGHRHPAEHHRGGFASAQPRDASGGRARRRRQLHQPAQPRAAADADPGQRQAPGNQHPRPAGHLDHPHRDDRTHRGVRTASSASCSDAFPAWSTASPAGFRRRPATPLWTLFGRHGATTRADFVPASPVIAFAHRRGRIRPGGPVFARAVRTALPAVAPDRRALYHRRSGRDQPAGRPRRNACSILVRLADIATSCANTDTGSPSAPRARFTVARQPNSDAPATPEKPIAVRRRCVRHTRSCVAPTSSTTTARRNGRGYPSERAHRPFAAALSADSY